VSRRRSIIEKTIVSILSIAIAVIFVVVTKPWDARFPRTHTPTDRLSPATSHAVTTPKN
jgi:uncharacterized membrane protein YvbJ